MAAIYKRIKHVRNGRIHECQGIGLRFHAMRGCKTHATEGLTYEDDGYFSSFEEAQNWLDEEEARAKFRKGSE
jgi:hypothetical protein